MKKYIKSYHVFLANPLAKVVLYLLYPVLVIVWCCLTASVMESFTESVNVSLLSASSLVLSAEMFLDIFVYGGILAKDTNKLEYLKTSTNGINVLKRSLIVDKSRRMITVALIIGAAYIVYNGQVSLVQMLSLVFVTSTTIELGLLVTRYFSIINWILAAMIVANLLGIGIGLLVIYLPSMCIIIFLMVFVMAVIGSNKLIMRKAEDSYYDERMERVV